MHTASIRKLALALSWSEQFFTLIYADYFWVKCQRQTSIQAKIGNKT